MKERNGSATRRTRSWTDADRRDHDWNLRHGRPLKTLTCAQWRRVRGEWTRPDHGVCEALTFGACACNCHFDWQGELLEMVVRLLDGRVGVCLGVLKDPEYVMMVHLGGGVELSVDIGEPVLLDQGGATTGVG
jgi:hypothetical protein